MSKKVIFVVLAVMVSFISASASAMGGFPFGKVWQSDSISYLAPCWGENNKIYFIKNVTFARVSEHPDPIFGGNYFVLDVKYFLCSMNYDGTEKKEIVEIMKEKEVNRIKRKYKKEYGKEWTGGASQSNTYMSYCQMTNKLVYNAGWGMWSINVDGSEETFLDYCGMHPSWSPNGKKIVYEIFKGGIWIMDADGNNKIRLSKEERIETFDNKSYVVYDDESPIWSPKGDLIAFVCNFWIWVMKPDGSERRRVSKGEVLDWYPDGNKLIANMPAVGKFGGGIGIINIVGEIEGVPKHWGTRWSPDGTMMVDIGFIVTNMQTYTKHDLFSDIKHKDKYFVYKKPDNIW